MKPPRSTTGTSHSVSDWKGMELLRHQCAQSNEEGKIATKMINSIMAKYCLNLDRILLTRRKGLSQKVRNTRFIHNQASLRPTARRRGITPVLSTGVNAAVLYTKHVMQLYPYWNEWPKKMAYQTVPISIFKSLSSASSHFHVSRSKQLD